MLWGCVGICDASLSSFSIRGFQCVLFFIGWNLHWKRSVWDGNSLRPQHHIVNEFIKAKGVFNKDEACHSLFTHQNVALIIWNNEYNSSICPSQSRLQISKNLVRMTYPYSNTFGQLPSMLDWMRPLNTIIIIRVESSPLCIYIAIKHIYTVSIS